MHILIPYQREMQMIGLSFFLAYNFEGQNLIFDNFIPKVSKVKRFNQPNDTLRTGPCKFVSLLM